MRTGIVYTTTTGRPCVQCYVESRDAGGNTLKFECQVTFAPLCILRLEFVESFIRNVYQYNNLRRMKNLPARDRNLPPVHLCTE
jgi:hypothetical protein